MASFVTTYMDSAAEKLMLENMNKNAIDYEEYPATVDLQNRCGELKYREIELEHN